MNTKAKTSIGLILVFMVLWGVGFGSSIFAGRCLNNEINIESRAIACNWASRITLAKYFEADHPEYAAIQFERVITRAESGKMEQSASAMHDLLQWVSIDQARQGNTGNQRDDKVAAVIFARVQNLDRNSNGFLVFSQSLGFREGT